ncbi:unnamed protein product [Adineta steineri]|uniref:B box-type domain-containing protein n=2 Tax=Adineta steineri TaxID=433720 RepID=A0A814HNI1_9BILA|nr:unnamed protein product [Adineta steineri]
MPPKSAALPQCDDCQSTEANYWCIECEISYCTTCSVAIHTRARAHHRRVPIYEKPIESKRCEQHRNEKLKYWCDCEKLICMDCHLSEQHKNHRTVPMSKGIFDITEKLKTEFKEAQTSLSQAITKDMLLTDINDNKNIQSITKTFDDLQQLMKELKELKSPIKTEYRIEGVDQLQTNIDNILKQARIVELIPESIQTNKNKFQQSAVTVAGGIFIDNDKSIYIADSLNHRIVKWTTNSNTGQIVGGGNGKGNKNNQLYNPTNIIYDEKNNSFIISDVRRYKQGDKKGELVAGGNGKGKNVNQLNCPYYIFIDEYFSLYISDHDNNRVMKWKKDAKEGIIVAGGNGEGNSLKQLSYPYGVIVDHLGQIYVADAGNHRVIRWREGEKEGEVVVGGNGLGNKSSQLNFPHWFII